MDEKVERLSSASSKRPHQPTVSELIEHIRSLSFADRVKLMREVACSPADQIDELVRLATLQLHGSLDLYGLVTSLERPSTLILTVLGALVNKLGRDYELQFAHATPPLDHADRGHITAIRSHTDNRVLFAGMMAGGDYISPYDSRMRTFDQISQVICLEALGIRGPLIRETVRELCHTEIPEPSGDHPWCITSRDCDLVPLWLLIHLIESS